MRRQTKPQGLAARWLARPLDIDPYQLPARFDLPVQSAPDRARRPLDRIEINPQSVAVERESAAGAAIRHQLPLAAFAGVAIRMEPMGEGSENFAVSINLHHDDPDLCIPLHVAYDLNDANARWQSWGRTLGLPLLLPALDGGWHEPLDRLGKVKVSRPCTRPPRKVLAPRRSCLSSVREVGDLRATVRVGGAEIIARN
ncbi:MAG: DUF6101 family protein [Pseudomonadota bacterium]|nr:DUF6101 family protein [Pseudomonadota bacterium]